MSGILKTVLSLSCSGSVLIILFFLFRPLVRKHLSKQWQYYIWLAVVARLLLPFTVEINLMETFFQKIEYSIVQLESASPSVRSISPLPERTVPKRDVSGKDKAGSDLHNGQLITVSSHIWWLCWLVTALILLIRKITIYQCFVRYMRAGCVEVADIGVLERFGKLTEKCRVKMVVELYTNGLISSPLLIGFFRPCIVLPTSQLSDSEFQYTILHELTHYKRRDMFYKWLVQAAACVHWFNPLVWLMCREVEQACELSCDEAVIKELDMQERRGYGDTLLNAIGNGGGYKNSIASVMLGESRERLQERLDAIKSFRRKSNPVLFLTAVLTIAICFGTAALGAHAAAVRPGSKAASTAKPQIIGGLVLIEDEYTIDELKALNIAGIVIDTLSDDVSIARGGDILKFEYYVKSPDEYTLQDVENPISSQPLPDRVLILTRPFPSELGDGRSITVTVPEQFPLEALRVKTTSGDISLTDCAAGSIETRTQNGQIDLYGGSVSSALSVSTQTSSVLVSKTMLPDSSRNTSHVTAFSTESGTIIFQPSDRADHYCFSIDYGEEAELFINNEEIEKGRWVDNGEEETIGNAGDLLYGLPNEEFPKESVTGIKSEFIRENMFTINENAGIKINFKSPRGTLIVQEN